MTDGAIYLSCGCRYDPSMGDIGSLQRTWVQQVCTRDADNPFVMGEITGVYCQECWDRMDELADE